MIDLQFVTQFMLQNFELTQVTDNGTHFLSRCILCGDSKKNPYKKRFNLDWNNGVPGWHCFNCGRRGNFIEIYSIVKGVSYDDAKKELFKYDKESVKRQMKKYRKRPEAIEKKEIDYDDFNWIRNKCYGLPWFTPDGLGIMERKYLSVLKKFYDDRKIPEKYKLYICHSGKYKGRIIIPIFNEENRIIYFQARRIPKSTIEPKYDNPVAPKELCILNKHLFDRNKSIIVHEGLIDAFMVGDQGTSCLGKEISVELIKELLKLTDKDVIIALDNDAEAYKSLAKFMKKNKYANKVKYFLYPKEFEGFDDINKIVRDNEKVLDVYELIVKNSVSYSSAFVKLKTKKII
jgi:hypothetical protein